MLHAPAQPATQPLFLSIVLSLTLYINILAAEAPPVELVQLYVANKELFAQTIAPLGSVMKGFYCSLDACWQMRESCTLSLVVDLRSDDSLNSFCRSFISSNQMLSIDWFEVCDKDNRIQNSFSWPDCERAAKTLEFYDLLS